MAWYTKRRSHSVGRCWQGVKNVLTRLRHVFGGDQTGEPPASDGHEPATLYSCSGCERTYVGTDKESCSRCAGPVEEIPSESDLGFGPRDV
jgi:hypothetical protein